MIVQRLRPSSKKKLLRGVGSGKHPRMMQLLPNMFTVLALCTGLSSVRFALLERWDLAVIAILVAAILDTVDGRLARFLGSVTDFGAELDSLADVVNFGVAPAVVIYLYSLHNWTGFGWGVCLFFCTCMALRLARFNVHRMLPLSAPPAFGAGFFTGVPAPAGAFLALLPLVVTFISESIVFSPFWFAFFMTGSSLLLISRVPTFSLKKVRIPTRAMIPFLVFVAFFAAALLSAPWETLAFIGFFYICSIPISFFWVRIQRKKALQKTASPD
ncbi:MAG: CDP-alcohol phosphatidyltransferase family protein [Alphaproteobacteria bacterium]